MSQPKGLVPFLPFSLIPVPGLLLALPYPPLFKRSLCFCIVFEFRLSHQQLIAVTHTPPPLFCSRFPFFFFFWKTENIGCAFGTKKTVVGCRGFVPRVSVAHPFDWFMLGCLVLPSLYDESVFCTEALSFFFFFPYLEKVLVYPFLFMWLQHVSFLHTTSRTSRVVFCSRRHSVTSHHMHHDETKKKQLLRDIVQTY